MLYWILLLKPLKTIAPRLRAMKPNCMLAIHWGWSISLPQGPMFKWLLAVDMV